MKIVADWGLLSLQPFFCCCCSWFCSSVIEEWKIIFDSVFVNNFFENCAYCKDKMVKYLNLKAKKLSFPVCSQILKLWPNLVQIYLLLMTLSRLSARAFFDTVYLYTLIEIWILYTLIIYTLIPSFVHLTYKVKYPILIRFSHAL